MTILFASNCIDDYSPIPEKSTDAAHRDSSRVDYAMGLSDNKSYIQRTPHVASSTTVTWYNFNFRRSGLIIGTQVGHMFEFVDINGNVIGQIDVDGYNFSAQVIGDTIVTGSIFTLPYETLALVAIQFIVTPTNITMNIYASKILVSSASADNTIGGKGNPVRFNLMMNDSVNINEHRISEIIASENDTRDMRLVKREGTGAGFHSDFVGNYANLSDDDDTTLVIASDNGDRLSVTLPTYSSGATIVAVVLSCRAAGFGIGPANMRQGFRISSTDYDGVQVSVGDSLENKIAVFIDDPATGIPWIQSGVNGAEMMMKAET